MQINSSVALVTGAASGLGAAAARRLAEGGAAVALLDLPTSAGAALAAQMGDNVHFVGCDVTSPDDVAQAVDWTVGRLGGLDICLNAAGVPTSARVVARDGTPFPLEDFRRVIEVNLIGTFDVMRHAAAAMCANTPGPDGERGVVINVSSGAAWQGQKGQAAYSASKAGVIGLMLPAARELGLHGIRVVTISPGLFQTAMADDLPPRVVAQMQAQALYPARPGDPDEFAALACHVITNTYINATNMSVDAGLRLA